VIKICPGMLQGNTAIVLYRVLLNTEYSWVHFRIVGCHSKVTHHKAKVILLGEDISESQDVYSYKSHYLVVHQKIR
jgi:hypothetical protein